MKKVIYLVSTALLTSAFILSCTKNNDTTSVTNDTYITQKPWIMAHLWGKKAIDSPWVLIDTSMLPCLKDNVTTYNTNSRFTIDEGRLKCDTIKNAPQILLSGTWSLQNNQTVLVTGSSVGSRNSLIEVLNSNQLQISYQESNYYYRELLTH